MFRQPQIPTLVQAILVMDSRNTMASVRSQSLTGSWSQLYRSGGIYLDLSLRSDVSGSTLMGHLVADPSQLSQLAGVAVLQKDSDAERSWPISSTGSFRIRLSQSGIHRLEVVLEDQVIIIEKLEV